MYGAPTKNCSGPENRDASILLGRLLGNAMIFSTVFDRFRAPRSIEASASVDSASKKRRSISVQKCTARQQKIVRAPKTAMRRFHYANTTQTLRNFRPFLTKKRVRLKNCLQPAGLAGLAGWAGWAGLVDSL